MENKRVSTQVHTRKLDRMVSHNNMKNKGLTRVNEKILGGKKCDNSYFAKNWKQYV